MSKVDAIEILRTFVSTQRDLIASLCKMESVQKGSGLFGVPWRGSISCNDVLWDFHKHGAGVCFKEICTGTTVDAHVEIFDAPDALDAWRLVQYFESKSVNAVDYCNETFDVTNEKGIQALFERLLTDRKVYALGRGCLYRLMEAATGSGR